MQPSRLPVRGCSVHHHWNQRNRLAAVSVPWTLADDAWNRDVHSRGNRCSKLQASAAVAPGMLCW
jgi:hypothetical protein